MGRLSNYRVQRKVSSGGFELCGAAKDINITLEIFKKFFNIFNNHCQ
jgi:hypothetical protein